MGTISLELSDRLYWLGRYTERVACTLGALGTLYDRLIEDADGYQEYLKAFGLLDVYGDQSAFFKSFLYDENNSGSVAYCLERAYDNGIVLRETISTEALAFLQMSKDILQRAQNSRNPRLSLMPLRDALYSFWGCIMDKIYDEEIWNLIFCGKSMERLDHCLRMAKPYAESEREFRRLCRRLRFAPEDTPYRYHQQYFAELEDILGDEENYSLRAQQALTSLEHLFEVSA